MRILRKNKEQIIQKYPKIFHLNIKIHLLNKTQEQVVYQKI